MLGLFEGLLYICSSIAHSSPGDKTDQMAEVGNGDSEKITALPGLGLHINGNNIVLSFYYNGSLGGTAATTDEKARLESQKC